MIRVNDLDYSYSQQDHALKGISFEVKDQEWLSILGHNGSGKSTISKLLVGILAPQKGSIYYDDIELTEKTVDKIRNRVGIVFQNPDNQFVGVNVKYDIAFGLENRCVPRSEMQKLIVEYATKVGMQDYLLREPQTLSGGQKQRVAIAGILALNTDVIILDEAQAIKNYYTSQTKRIKSLNAGMKIAMTGTPIENNVLELWSIFDFIMPGYLYNKNKFTGKK